MNIEKMAKNNRSIIKDGIIESMKETLEFIAIKEGITRVNLCKIIGISRGSLTDFLKYGKNKGYSTLTINKIMTYIKTKGWHIPAHLDVLSPADKPKPKSKHIGSKFDDLLREEGIDREIQESAVRSIMREFSKAGITTDEGITNE